MLFIGVFVFLLGYLYYKNKWVVFVGVFGLIFLSSLLFVEWIGLGYEVFGEYGEVIIMVIVLFIIVGVYLINYRFRLIV